MSAQGDYLRAQLNTVTTFNMMLDTVADAFDLGDSADDAAPDQQTGSDEDDEPANEPAQRSRSPAVSRRVHRIAELEPKKKRGVIKRKTRRRY